MIPPYRELGEAEEGDAGEGGAVVGTDRQRQAEVLESALKDAEGELLLGGRQSVTAEQIAAGKVADGQRIAVTAIGQHKLARGGGSSRGSSVHPSSGAPCAAPR